MKLASVKVMLFAMTLVATTSVYAQTRHRHEREPRETEHAAPAVSVDKRDTIIPGPGAFSGKPFWLALAQCGGIYFKLNVLYTAVAVQARAVKPDPKLNSEYTQKLNDAIKTATAFFSGAEHFLMTDRNLERIEAVLIYDEQSRAAADRVKSAEAGISAAKACPALYEACQKAFAKVCNESLAPTS
ncbi:MAG TPA: hypothetical protein VEI98_11035 [Xanthobacteraceae bacterium]|nr:hypothetical protein [Xanthobacteraceae bacterium]